MGPLCFSHRYSPTHTTLECENRKKKFILRIHFERQGKQLDSDLQLGCQSALMEFSINLWPKSLKRRQALYGD